MGVRLYLSSLAPSRLFYVDLFGKFWSPSIMAEDNDVLPGNGSRKSSLRGRLVMEQMSIAERDYATLMRLGKKPVLKVLNHPLLPLEV